MTVEGQGELYYLGQTSRTFKSRLANHLSDFRISTRRKNTALSKFIWSLAEKNANWSIAWEKVSESVVYSRESRICLLCLEEKMSILKLMQAHPDNTINQKHELLTPCCHKHKELLEYPDYNNEIYVNNNADNIQQTQNSIPSSYIHNQIIETHADRPLS